MRKVTLTQEMRMAKKRTHVRLSLSIESPERDPLGALRGLRKATQSIQLHVPEIVRMAREQRCTWAEIGGASALCRQAAWERFSVD